MLAVNHAALNRSIAHDGNREELVALFEKLYAREAVTVGVIGASVAQNAGCLDQPSVVACISMDGINSHELGHTEDASVQRICSALPRSYQLHGPTCRTNQQ